MKEISILARNKCYILPYCQGTDPCGYVKYFAKYSLTAMPLTLSLVPTGCTLSIFIQSVIELNAIIFPCITVWNAARFNDIVTKVRFYVNWSPFIIQNFKGAFDYPSCS